MNMYIKASREKIELLEQKIAGAVWSSVTESYRRKKKNTDYISIILKISFAFGSVIFMAVVLQVKCNQ